MFLQLYSGFQPIQLHLQQLKLNQLHQATQCNAAAVPMLLMVTNYIKFKSLSLY